MNVPVDKINPMTLNDLYRQAGVQQDVSFAQQITMNPERVPMPHQVRNLNRILVNGYWGFFDDPGCGKTLPMQAAALYFSGHGIKTIALMPPVLKSQFKKELHSTFIGSDNAFTLHTLDEGPYPVRVTKRKVQAIKAAIKHGTSFGDLIPCKLREFIAKMRVPTDIGFTQSMVNFIRGNSEKAEELAIDLGCSAHAIRSIRAKTFREDLFNKWDKEHSWPDILVMSYHMFIKVNKEVEKPYKMLIADESQVLCHPSSSTHKKVKRFLSKDEGDTLFIAASGTPIPNVLTDAYGLIKLLNPKAYGSYSDFERTHCDIQQVEDRGGRRFKVTLGYRNEDLVAVNLFAKASRVTKEQVFTLPKPVIQLVDIDLSKEHRNLYRKLVRERVLEVDGEVISAVEAQSLRQKCARIVTCPDQFSNSPIKENNVRIMLEQKLDEIGCAHKEKVVIFGIYRKSIETMGEWFKGLNPALVYGGSNTKKQVDKFLNDESCRLMIANPRSGGVGLNLQGVCRYVIFVEPTSVPGEFTQASDRVYRKGQDKVVTVYIFRALKTIWPKMIESMLGKMRITKAVTKDKSKMLDELLGER